MCEELKHTTAGIDKQFWVTALKNIKCCKEITLSYLGRHDLNSSHDERKILLKESWGFDCVCALCVGEAESRTKLQLQGV